MITHALRVLVLALCLPACLHAQRDSTARAGGLTLHAAIDSALRHNPDVAIAHSLVDSARAESAIARALPNPTLSVIPGTPTQYAATLPIDVGPQRTYRSRASTIGVRAVQGDARDSERQLSLAVERAFYDVLLADARRGIASDRREVVRQLLAADSARVHAGDLPERAIIRSEVELLRADADIARAGVEAQAARFALQALMGVAHPDSALVVDGSLHYAPATVDSARALELARANRPDLAASRERESQGDALVSLARAELVPVPQLSYVRQFSAPFETGRYAAIGVGLEVPLLGLYSGQRARAAAGREAAASARRRVETQVEREVQGAMADLRVQDALVRRYESGVVGKVKENVSATQYAYEHGATSLLEVLDALRAQQDLLGDYYTALHDYWIAVFTLRAAAAMPPE